MRVILKFPKIEEKVYKKILPEYFYIDQAKDAHLQVIEDELAVYSRKEVTEYELKSFFAAYTEIRNTFHIAAEKIVENSPYCLSIGLFTVFIWYKHIHRPTLEIPASEHFNTQVYQEKVNNLKYLISKSLIPFTIFESRLQDREPEITSPKPPKKKDIKPAKAAKKSPESDTFGLFS